MKTNKFCPSHRILKVVFGALAILCSSCSKDDGNENLDPGVVDTTSFKAVIENGDEFQDVPQSRNEETVAEGGTYPEDYTTGDGSEAETLRFICTSRTVSVTDGTGNFQTLGGVASEIYPGALLQGKTINNVKPQAIPLKRAGGSISYNLNDGNLQASQNLDEMSESQVRQAMNTIISGSSGVVPSNFDLVYENVFSEEQLALKMGLSYEGYGLKAEGKLSFSTEQQYNRVLVKLNQSYYDISYDFPTSYDDVFDESVTPEELAKYIQADNPATYIKKVTYGRIFYMLVESTSSLEEMNTQISASYDGFNNSIEGDLEVETMKKMENLKVKVIAYGGDSQNTFGSLGETNVEALADMLSKSTDIRTGLPLSYEIYSLEDPSKQVGVNISTEMEVVECELKGVLPPVLYSNLVDLFEDGIGAATQINGEYTAVFNGAGTKYVIFNASDGSVSVHYDIKDENGPLGATSFDSIGAAIRQYLDVIYLFNAEGTQYEILEYGYNPIYESPTEPIGSFKKSNGNNRRYVVNDTFTQAKNEPDDFIPTSFQGVEGRDANCTEFPLFGKGIQAAVRHDVYDQDIALYQGEAIVPYLVKGEVTSSYYYSRETNGATYTRRNYYNPTYITTPSGTLGFADIDCWEPETNAGEIRGTVEAACKFNVNGSSIVRMLFFSTDGYLVLMDFDGNEEGPFAL